MGGAVRALGVVVLLAGTGCGEPIDARLPGGVPSLTMSALAEPRSPETPAEQVAPSAPSRGTGFGGSGAAGSGEEEAAEAVSAQSVLWTRNLIGGMGFRPVGR